MKISMIGYGSMGKALCQGLLKNPHYHLHVAAPSLMAGQLQPNLRTSSDNLALLQNTDVLILAVKPAQMADVLAKIHAHLPAKLPIISIAAGLDMSWYAKRLPQHTPVVRAIPNLAAACQQSATPLLANTWVTTSQHALATDLFLQCGQITWTEHEKDLDTITALAGSGLAYLFAFTQAMSEGAIALGLSSETANRFAIQTLAGAASLATLSEHSLLELQQQVTSKAGTTAAALDVFAQYQLSNIVLTAMRAAVARSQTLRSEES
ncbi:MAG: pyrroline-5-carboxylate reductase [Legionellales bacterium]|nr:pyrroline-5-carboxylate reductase [Legionellales bacterium]